MTYRHPECQPLLLSQSTTPQLPSDQILRGTQGQEHQYSYMNVDTKYKPIHRLQALPLHKDHHMVVRTGV